MTTITAAEARALMAPKKSKYGNRKVTIDGITFDSTKEANRWRVLKDMQDRGKISSLERQPRFNLCAGGRPVRYGSGRQAYYKADFAYWDGEKRVVEDVKGFKTKEYKLKKAIVEAMFPAVTIVEI